MLCTTSWQVHGINLSSHVSRNGFMVVWAALHTTEWILTGFLNMPMSELNLTFRLGFREEKLTQPQYNASHQATPLQHAPVQPTCKMLPVLTVTQPSLLFPKPSFQQSLLEQPQVPPPNTPYTAFIPAMFDPALISLPTTYSFIIRTHPSPAASNTLKYPEPAATKNVAVQCKSLSWLTSLVPGIPPPSQQHCHKGVSLSSSQHQLQQHGHLQVLHGPPKRPKTIT
jgi:hypothetical protein